MTVLKQSWHGSSRITQLTRAGGRPVLRSASTSMRVVFPAPEAPMRAVSTPGLKAPVMPCHAKTHTSAAKQRPKPRGLWRHSVFLMVLCLQNYYHRRCNSLLDTLHAYAYFHRQIQHTKSFHALLVLLAVTCSAMQCHGQFRKVVAVITDPG